jgi:RNA polymerase sigma-70 factor (ECF subfamily)
MFVRRTAKKGCDGMAGQEWLAERFEANRGHLRAVAYRMLGSLGEAEDAIQEAWLRLNRSDVGNIENLSGWLTTVVARVCLDVLRSRKSRGEESLGTQPQEPTGKKGAGSDPEQEAMLADSVGLALLVVLDRLAPAERVAFVMHDLFGLSFEEIATIVERSPTATRQLASRARRRVRGVAQAPSASLSQEREVIGAFLKALRAGDVEGLLAVLDPDLVVRVDGAAARGGAPQEVRGAENWARGAVAYARFIRSAIVCLVDGAVGAVLAPDGRLARVLRFAMKDGKIAQIEVLADPARLDALHLAVLPD